MAASHTASRDLTRLPGNPASSIHDRYATLMAIADADELRREAIALVNEGGISAKNRAAFLRTVAGLGSLSQLQSYLTNFMLRAAGLGVI